MTQDTTREFSYRLNQSVAGHPLAPPTSFGIQSWLRKKLLTETRLDVSVNTVSKWFNGQSLPRADSIRKIAQVLQVDEMWLSIGLNPVARSEEKRRENVNARAAVMVLAGVLEMGGGRVTFADDPDGSVDLHVNLDGKSFSAVVVSPKRSADAWSYMIPEPVGAARVLSVSTENSETGNCSACLCVLDITDCPRQVLGGYSLVVLTRRRDGKFKVDGQRSLLSPLTSVEELAG